MSGLFFGSPGPVRVEPRGKDAMPCHVARKVSISDETEVFTYVPEPAEGEAWKGGAVGGQTTQEAKDPQTNNFFCVDSFAFRCHLSPAGRS